MRKRRAKWWPPVAALAVVAVVGAGCCSDSGTGPDDGDLEYPDQSTPDNVIEKLGMAYEEMDAEAYLDCLAEDFVFFLNPDEVEGDPTLPEYWGKAEETVIVHHMFADTTAIESVLVTLTVGSRDSLPGEDPGDPADDLWEYLVDVDLRVDAGVTLLSSGSSLFVMRRAPDREEPVWQIIEHHDLGHEEVQREDTTWTAIKLVFGGDVQDSLYPIRSNPSNVLRKLNLAYVRMDAEAYLDCLAEDFAFFLNPDDVNDDPELPDFWNKAEETTIHGNMFGEDSDVGGVSLIMTLQSESYDPGDPGDPFDDTWTFLEAIDLRVQLPPDLTLHAQAPCEFSLGIDPDETGAGGRSLWEITTWYDLSTESGRWSDPTHEHASWGRIKALYR
jgi:ketosteroid isomerase-like protein